jgi:predicted amidohydrolase
MTVIATVALAGGYDVDLSTKNHMALIDEAAASGAQLVVFPEISLQGYPPDFASFYPERIRAAFDNAESVPDGPHVQAIAEHAKELGVYVIYGLNELGTSPGVIYNTTVLTGPDGFVGKYRKVHVGITEQLTWRKGNDWPVFDTAIGRIGMLICYDKMWPESTRELTLRGADILVMSTAWFMAFGDQDPETNVLVEQYRLYDRVRAAENGRWFVSSNFAGELGGGQFIGLSQIVDPCGRVVATTGVSNPGIAIADVDISGGIAEANSMQGARLVRDRRPDTYLAMSGQLAPAIDG